MCKITEEIYAEGFAEGFVEGYAEGYAKTVGEDFEEGYEELRAKLARPIAMRLVERGFSVDSIALAVDRSVPTVEGWIKESGTSLH